MTTITFRADAEIQHAIEKLTSDGTSTSNVIRESILEAVHRREDEELRAESAAAAADPDDVAEMRRVLADMESLRAW